MPTRRANILANRKTVLLTVANVKNVEINKASIIDMINDPMPAIYIYSASQTPAVGVRSMNTKETWNWDVALEIWAQDTDMETITGNVYAKWYEDATCGGIAITSILKGVDTFDVDVNRRLLGVEMLFEVQYRHEIGLPFT
ncbi:MAG: hypothetical protein ACUZ8E_04195 [Candidatus Anammoxibacter sp.]